MKMERMDTKQKHKEKEMEKDKESAPGDRNCKMCEVWPTTSEHN